MRSRELRRIAVFLDRDDTLIRDTGYLSDPGGIELLPGAVQGLCALNQAGIPVIVVTNQSCIARGLFDEKILHVIHARLLNMLKMQGARIDALYYCPHHPDGIVQEYRMSCSCRKPQPGMLLQAARDFGLDLAACSLVGDKAEDIEAIHCVKATGVLIRTDKAITLDHTPEYIAQDLPDAVHWILETMKP
jgi:D-glycero-D-manno-heptose 1,7-bisphosphate phosphatase